MADRKSVRNSESDILVAGRVRSGEDIDKTVAGRSACNVRVLRIDHETARSSCGCEIDILLGLRAEDLPQRIVCRDRIVKIEAGGVYAGG
jgi:hypothetical protein